MTSEDQQSSVLVPQPHGGAIKAGNPGNKGGGNITGRLRRKLAELSDTEAIKVLTERLKDASEPKLQLAASDLALKHALPSRVEVIMAEGVPEFVGDLIRKYVPDELKEAALAELQEFIEGQK